MRVIVALALLLAAVSANNLGNSTACTYCLEVANQVESHLQTIHNLLDQVCQRITNTAEKLACEAAVAALVKLLESDSAQQICTTLHLCPGTIRMSKTLALYGAILPAMNQIGTKRVGDNVCTYCEEAAGYLIQNKKVVAEALSFACNAVPDQYKQVCSTVAGAINSMLASDTAEQICQTLKVCTSGKSMLKGTGECEVCKLAWLALQREAPQIETALEADCSKITNSSIVHSICDKAVEKGVQYITSTSGNTACQEFGLCGNSSLIHIFKH
jgi:hypothetical protein